MPQLDRRRWLLGLGALSAHACLPLAVRSARAAQRPFDLLIRGGEVLDPSQSLRARMDIGVRNGAIAAVQPLIAPDQAAHVIDASGRLVTPGLIDLHSHCFPYGSALAIPADEIAPLQGTTTAVSAGDAGANNFAAFRRFVVGATRTRLYAFVHIANMGLAGFPAPELYELGFADTEVAARALAENSDMAIGIKVRMSENVIARHGMEPLRRALAACEMAGGGAKVMCHIGGVETRKLMSQILDALRPGDILTHCYSGAPNLGGDFTNIVQDGKLLPAALAAKRRGVHFDVGHGAGSFDYTIAEAAIAQGALPDTLSSDMHVISGNTPGKPYLTWVMSKFLNMGFTLEQVIAMVTVNASRAIGRLSTLGTLQVGASADIALLDLVEGPVSFVDTRNNTRNGNVHLRVAQTIRGGVPFGAPYSMPFSVR